MQQIILDMDGTFVDLYGVENWEYQLHNSMTTPYEIAAPLVDMDEFNMVLNEARNFGAKIVVVSWVAIDASKEYSAQIRKAKKQWCENYNMPIDEFHVVKYGTKKWYPLKNKTDAVLFDDNADVRAQFESEKDNRVAYDVINMIDMIKTIINTMQNVVSNNRVQEMIKTALENKTMAYIYTADDWNDVNFTKIGMTTKGEERIKNYRIKNKEETGGKSFTPRNKKIHLCFPCRTSIEADLMEAILRYYFSLQKNNLYKPKDRFYDVQINLDDILKDDSIVMQVYHNILGY